MLGLHVSRRIQGLLGFLFLRIYPSWQKQPSTHISGQNSGSSESLHVRGHAEPHEVYTALRGHLGNSKYVYDIVRKRPSRYNITCMNIDNKQYQKAEDAGIND